MSVASHILKHITKCLAGADRPPVLLDYITNVHTIWLARQCQILTPRAEALLFHQNKKHQSTHNTAYTVEKSPGAWKNITGNTNILNSYEFVSPSGSWKRHQHLVIAGEQEQFFPLSGV